MPKARSSSQMKKTKKAPTAKKARKSVKKPVAKMAKKSEPVKNPIARLLEQKKARQENRSVIPGQSGTWSKAEQASHTWDHRFTKFAGPRRRAS